jgi:uncharacterized membrane protein
MINDERFSFESTMDIMNLKRMFGALLTLMGIIGLIYAAILFANVGSSTHAIKAIVIYAVLGLLFFASGIGLIRSTKDI